MAEETDAQVAARQAELARAPYVVRRRELKAQALMVLSILADEMGGWESLVEDAARLRLSDQAIVSVSNELRDELWRRAVNLTPIPGQWLDG